MAHISAVSVITLHHILSGMAKWHAVFESGGDVTVEADGLIVPNDETGFVVLHEGSERLEQGSDRIVLLVPGKKLKSLRKLVE